MKVVLTMLVIFVVLVLLVGCENPNPTAYPTPEPTIGPYPQPLANSAPISAVQESAQMSGYFTVLWSLLQNGLFAFAILVVLDIVFGIIVALVKKTFKWEYLMHFVNTDLIPIFVWIGAVVLGTIPQNMVPKEAVPVAATVIYGFVFIGILSSILGSWKDLGVLTEVFNKIGIGDKQPPG